MSIFREADGWTYEVFPLTDPAKSFGDFAPMVELWSAKGKGDRLPAWRDFELEDLMPWVGWISVADVVQRDPFDMRYRLWGQALAEAIGSDLTGKLISEFPSGYDQDDVDFLEHLAKQKGIGLWSGPVYWENRDYVRMEQVSVPLADDGETPDKIMHVSMVR